MKPSFAGLWLRILAFALDYIVIAGYLITLIFIGTSIKRVFPLVSNSLFANPISGQLTGSFLITLPVSLYFALSESSTRQATWGKRKMGMKVVRTDGASLSLPRALGRTALKFIPWELTHTCIWQISFHLQTPSPFIYAGFMLVWVLIGVNIASRLINKFHQTAYDRLAGTFVIKV